MGIDTGHAPFAVKLAGATGALQWLTADTTVNLQSNPELEVDSAGNAFMAAEVVFANDYRINLWKLSAGGGTSLWTRLLGGGPSQDFPRDLAVTGAGDLVIAATLASEFALVKLNGADGTCSGAGCPETLKTGVIKIGEVFQKKWLWGITATGTPLTLPPAGSADDPSITGATIALSNPTTRERAVFVLPPGADWRLLGSRTAPGAKGYLYQDKQGRSGPCTMLKMVPGKKLTLQCKATGPVAPFTLDETSQGALDVHIQIGAFEYCLSSAGGELIEDRATVPGGKKGLFKVKNAPPPMRCG